MKNSIVRFSFLVAVVLASVPSDVRASAGDLYSGQLSFKEVDKFTPAGGTPTVFVSGFFADALAFDSRGNLFVADVTDHKIKKVTPGGGTTDFATIGNPMGLAFDAAGNLFVSDASTGSIKKLTPTGAISTFASGLNGPFGLAFDRNGNLFVSETNSGTIKKFPPAGPPPTTFASGLNSPEGLAFDSAGNLYEVDFSTGKIFKFTPGGAKSTFAMGLVGPRNIAIDQSDNIFVANFSSQEILKFTAAGGAPTTFASNANAGGLAFEPATAQLTNVSTRGFVGTGDNVMIAGFITSGGNGSTRIVVRGLGPTLAAPPFNITGALADPTVTLVDQNGAVVQTNDNWKNTQQAAIQRTGLAPPNDLESAMVVTVATGRYTAILSGKNGGTGIGLVEVYKVK